MQMPTCAGCTSASIREDVSAVGSAALLVTFPIGAAVVSSTVAAVRRPGPRVTSAVQHFAAGVVFAAVAGEVLPDLRNQHSRTAMIIGFAAGVAAMLLIDRLSGRAERQRSTGVPTGLLVAIAVDLLIDGLLVGMGAALGEGQGRILAIALTLEVLFLGLSLAIELGERGLSALRAAFVTSAVACTIAIGAVGGAALLAGASHATLAAVLAFGAAALLYLVTEELLVEAHEGTETTVLTAMFFVGFLAIYLLEG
jgi:ZIP family zinc transporter